MISVAVVEDDRDAREAVCAVIEAADGPCAARMLASAEEALAVLPDLEPDAVLMDIQLTGMNGSSAYAS
ncbi:MAG: response regulator [Flavobacteriales bacterium]|nr:response regulator [Flavobacteriales bacterium]